MKHSETPWEIYEGANFVKVGARGYREWCDKHDYLGGPKAICDVEYHANENYTPNHKRAMELARLIVFAPELLNALRWSVNHEGECLGDYPEILDAAKTLLAKIEGAATPEPHKTEDSK